jgi:hypothetical protein
MRKWEIGVLVAVSIIVSLVYYYPILNSGNNLGIQDWDQNFAWTEATRVSLLDFHQFPFWNPYKCGGSVQFAAPETPVISLQTLFALLFGTIRGIKLSIFFHGAIGLIGFYLLARQYGVSKVGSLLAAMIFSFSGITGSFLSTGMVVFTNFAYTPFILYFFNKGLQNWKWGIASGALYALAFYYGYHIPLVLGVYIFIYTLVKSIVNRTITPLKTAAILVATATILMLPKLLLEIQIMRIFPRSMNDVSGYGILNFFRLLLAPIQDLFYDYKIPGSKFNIDESSLYVGILSLILFLFFFVRNRNGIRKHSPLLITLFFIFWLMLGNRNLPSLYQVLHKLPLFSSFRVAQRFRFDFIIPFSILAGLGLDNAVLYLAKYKWARLLPYFFLLGIFIDLTLFSSMNFLSKTLIVKNPESSLARSAVFSQTNVSGLGVPLQRTIPIPIAFLDTKAFKPYSYEYLKIRQNKGVLECYDAIYEPVSIYVHASGIEGEGGHSKYQGEYYLLDPVQGIKVENTFWSPNKLVYKITNAQNAMNNMLIINQNYYPGWIVRTGKFACSRVIDYQGLIATGLDGAADNITLEFNPLLLYLHCWH